MRHAIKIAAIAPLFALSSVACGGLLGVDFSDARPIDSAGAPPDLDGGGADAEGGTVSVDAADGASCGPCGELATCQANVCVPSVLHGMVAP